MKNHIPTGQEIKRDIGTIVASNPKDLVADLASYVMRVRNESFRSNGNCPRAALHESQENSDSTGQRAFPSLQANSDGLSFGAVPDREEQASMSIEIALKNVTESNITGVVDGEHQVLAIGVNGDERTQAGCGNDLDLHEPRMTK